MLLNELFLREASIGKSNLSSIPGYVDAVNQMLKQNTSFQMGERGQFTFQPTAGQQIASVNDSIAGKGQNQTGKEVDQVQVGFIFKSPQIKQIAKGTPADQIVFNAGEVAEGIHAIAAFVRLITRPSKQIQLSDLYPIVNRIENGKTLVLQAKEVDSNIADEFRVTLSLKSEQFAAFKQLDKIAGYAKLKNIARDVIDDANAESGRFADMYEKNGKFDRVSVIGDGVSGETQTKTDINFDNETERKYKGYSIKAGTTQQMHQVGGGASKLSAEERFDIINKELFGVHGRAQLIDIESGKASFAQLWNSGKYVEAYRKAYEQAVDAINDQLDTDQEENQFVSNLVNALKYWMRRDEEGVVLKQFSGTNKGTYILDAERLNDLQAQGLNLIAQMAPTQDPTLRILDGTSGKVLVEIRAKGEKQKAGYYFRNIINKGPLFVQLTNIANR